MIWLIVIGRDFYDNLAKNSGEKYPDMILEHNLTSRVNFPLDNSVRDIYHILSNKRDVSSYK